MVAHVRISLFMHFCVISSKRLSNSGDQSFVCGAMRTLTPKLPPRAVVSPASMPPMAAHCPGYLQLRGASLPCPLYSLSIPALRPGDMRGVARGGRMRQGPLAPPGAKLRNTELAAHHPQHFHLQPVKMKRSSTLTLMACAKDHTCAKETHLLIVQRTVFLCETGTSKS
jgi:hypothetical protein